MTSNDNTVRIPFTRECLGVTTRLYYVTFGVQYRQEEHPTMPGVDPDGYFTIEAPNATIARRIANALFDQHWAFMYHEPQDHQCPLGELGRVVLVETAR